MDKIRLLIAASLLDHDVELIQIDSATGVQQHVRTGRIKFSEDNVFEINGWEFKASEIVKISLPLQGLLPTLYITE